MDCNKKQVPLKEGLWLLSDGEVRLVGSGCSLCGEIFFPKKESKFCPHCQREGLQDVILGNRGKISTYTVVCQQPAGGFYKGPVPYAYGVVQLPEGVNVETLFTGCDLGKIKTGLEARLVIEKLHEAEDGTEVVTYKFVPEV
ncbi:MAG: Zn-ribbon domain-containing OB-fold protein [Bacillota bacterium]